MKMPRTEKQKAALEKKIKDLEKQKKNLVRNKDKYSPTRFYKDLNAINRQIASYEGKI